MGQVERGRGNHMATGLRLCIDRATAPTDLKKRLVAAHELAWGKDFSLRIAFLEGEQSLRRKVELAAQRWTQYASIKLYFGAPAEQAQIRIAFRQGQGSWSWVGKQCLNVTDPKEPTMNFGWLSPDSEDDEIQRVVLHEFGHALGCLHEHQSPQAKIRWKKDAVYAAYAGPPNYWNPEQVESNVLALYDQTLTTHSHFDAQSIMLYPIAKELTEDGFEVTMNRELSPTDIEFIRKVYPR